jgi:hypothetical protein
MRLHQPNSTCALFGGINGDIQVVVGTRTVLIDAQGAERGTDGVLRQSHGAVRLTYATARDLADLIDHMGEPTDPRQPALWSESTFVEPIRPPVRGRRRRVAA